MNDPSHPLWALLRGAGVLVALIVVLYMNAEKFDTNEIATIITMFLALLGAEGFTRVMTKKPKNDEDSPYHH